MQVLAFLEAKNHCGSAVDEIKENEHCIFSFDKQNNNIKYGGVEWSRENIEYINIVRFDLLNVYIVI